MQKKGSKGYANSFSSKDTSSLNNLAFLAADVSVILGTVDSRYLELAYLE